MDEKPTDRVIDQRLRNRIMEALSTLADGDDGVRREWPDEYFEMFYDQIPHRQDGNMRPNSAITPQERQHLLEVSAILDDACDATPQNMVPDQLIETGWPKRIQPIAQRALEVFLERGRFDENQEQDEPLQSGA